MKDDRQKKLERFFWITWFILFFLTGVIVWSLTVSSDGARVNNYISKTPGKSAYQLAVDEGFKGSVKDWLLSLKAEPVKGEDGEDSVSHNTVERTTVKETVIKEKTVPGPVGPQGKQGENGFTPQLAQDSITGQLYTKLPQDDDWKLVPKLCLGSLCGGEQ